MKIISRRARPHKVTVYNYVSSVAGVATYQRTVIDRVYLDTGYAQRLSQKGVNTSDKAQLIIDLRDVETNGRTYLAPLDWAALADKTGNFTFATANDFFIVGEVEDELPSLTKAQMIQKHQCFSVTSVSLNGYILQVTGK